LPGFGKNCWGSLAQTDNVVIGTTVDMRSEAETEDVVGCFIKTVPLPLRVDQDQTITELVRHAQKTVRKQSRTPR
jgi:non-ribosomal peptide synthetase component F